MNELWKKVNTEDGREILFALYKVKDINEAYDKTANVIKIIQENDMIEGSQISLSPEDLMITLHGKSKERISQKDWESAMQIEALLSQL